MTQTRAGHNNQAAHNGNSKEERNCAEVPEGGQSKLKERLTASKNFPPNGLLALQFSNVKSLFFKNTFSEFSST